VSFLFCFLFFCFVRLLHSRIPVCTSTGRELRYLVRYLVRIGTDIIYKPVRIGRFEFEFILTYGTSGKVATLDDSRA
jgi:hypothetical protein